MELDAFINEICARVQEKIRETEKPKLLVLTLEHGSMCHEVLECTQLAEYYQTECALMSEYQCCMKDYEAVIAFTLTNEALGKIAHGIFDDGYTRLFGKALLSGRKIYVVKEDVELFSVRETAPAAYYRMMEGNLKILTDSNVIIADRKQIAEMILGHVPEQTSGVSPVSAICEINEIEEKKAVLDKKIITEKDMIALGNEHVKTVLIRPKSILTDLAKEYASRHKMTVQRTDISSDKRG